MHDSASVALATWGEQARRLYFDPVDRDAWRNAAVLGRVLDEGTVGPAQPKGAARGQRTHEVWSREALIVRRVLERAPIELRAIAVAAGPGDPSIADAEPDSRPWTPRAWA